MNSIVKRRSALVQILRECNFTCLHCSQAAPHTGSSPLHPIGLDQYEARLASLVKMGLQRVRLTGGEPLLHPHLEDLIRIGVRFGLDMSLVTNGSLLERQAEKLSQAGLSRIWISLYGSSLGQYQRVAQRKPPAKGLIRAIGVLVEFEVKVGIYCCLHSSAEEPDLSLLQELTCAGINEVRFLQVMEQGRALSDPKFGANLPLTLLAIKNFASSNPRVQIGVSMRSGQALQFRSLGFSVPEYFGCVSGSPDSWAVDVDGQVHPCCLFMGNAAAAVPNTTDGCVQLGRCPALPSYPEAPVDDFVCPLTYARL